LSTKDLLDVLEHRIIGKKLFMNFLKKKI